MGSILNFLKGKKTYLVAIGAIIGILISWAETGNLDFTALITAVLSMTVRAGISKNLSSESSK